MCHPISLVLTATLAPVIAAPATAQGPDPRIAAMLDSITPDRLAVTLRRLKAYETRQTLSDTVSAHRAAERPRQSP
jgi:hypothetical protein